VSAGDVECRPGCGACCDPVVLPYTQSEARGQAHRFEASELRWILDDLVPMSRREAKAKFPELFERVSFGVVDGQLIGDLPMFYSCGNLDPETRLCGIHDHRPEACRQYPWYGQGPDRRKALPAECEFQREVGREPVMVALTAKPSA